MTPDSANAITNGSGYYVNTYPNNTTTGDTVTIGTTAPYNWTWPYPYTWTYSWPDKYDDTALREKVAALEGQVKVLTELLAAERAAPKRKARKGGKRGR